MCLYTDGELHTATEDIVVWKELNKIFKYDYKGNTGDKFTAIVSNYYFLIGEQHIEGEIEVENNLIYLCTNSIKGVRYQNKHGYKYSWALDNHITKLIVNGKRIKKKFFYITPYRNMYIELGKTYESRLISVTRGELVVVNIGLHSHTTPSPHLYTCIIPKGSNYYVSLNGKEIASDRLTYLKSNKFNNK